MVALDIFVRIPVAPGEAIVIPAPDLHEPHSSFEQAAGDQALPAEVLDLFGRVDLAGPTGLAMVEAVELQDVLRFPPQVERFGGGQLHAGRQFVTADAGFKTRVSRAFPRMVAVQPPQQLLGGPFAVGRHKPAAAVGVEIGDGGRLAGENDRSLVLGGQKRRVPVLGAIRGKPPVIGQHHKRRQVFVQAAKAVTDPAPHSRKARQLEPGRLQIGRLAVDPRLADEVVDERHVVDTGAQVGHDFRERFARLAIRLELPDRLHPRAEAILERLDRLAEIRRLAVVFLERRLVVEQIDVAGGPPHEELHHAFGARREIRHVAASPQPGGRGQPVGPRGVGRQQPFLLQQAAQGQPGKPAPYVPQEIAAGEGIGRCAERGRRRHGSDPKSDCLHEVTNALWSVPHSPRVGRTIEIAVPASPPDWSLRGWDFPAVAWRAARRLRLDWDTAERLVAAHWPCRADGRCAQRAARPGVPSLLAGPFLSVN